jgi:hypothetical protein
VDGRQFGKLDSAGSLGPSAVTADVEHVIQLRKDDDHEEIKVTKRAPAKEAIVLSGADARLKLVGILEFQVQPQGAQVSINQQGEAPRRVTEKSMRFREGAYIVKATADGYDTIEKSVTVVSGPPQIVRVALVRTAGRGPRDEVKPSKPIELPELFDDPKNWTRNDKDFWIHDGPSWMAAGYFNRVFNVFKGKNGLFGKAEKVGWLIYLDNVDYLEFELDGSNLSWRDVIGGKPTPWVKKAHKETQKAFYRLELNVANDGVLVKVGEARIVISRKVTWRTGFRSKVGLRLVK